MDNNLKQKIEKSDFHTLIDESVKQIHEAAEKKAKSNRRNRLYEFLKVAITPVAIAVFSLIVTSRINHQQMENTKLINEQQMANTKMINAQQAENTRKINEQQLESAKIIAEANLKQSKTITRLTHLKDIFRTILESTKNKENFDLIKMQIASMEVYKKEALLFLINLKNHFAETADKCVDCNNLSEEATNSILNILRNSQIDVSQLTFNGQETATDKKRGIISLRKQKYDNYNFSGCTFSHANLYQTTFSSCTIIKAIFKNADLYQTNFIDSNLSGTTFENVDLRKARFDKVRLDDVRFVNAKKNKSDDSCQENGENKCENSCQLEGAFFSLGSLLKTDRLPFKGMEKEVYINLLLPHRERIQEMAQGKLSGDQLKNFNNLLKKTECQNVDQLEDLLDMEAKESEFYSPSAKNT
jgi:uncharacterized protein YjbI with pentapeptide repeats